jgi:hypothetical protein
VSARARRPFGTRATRLVRRHHAGALAILALVATVGGTAYATGVLPRASVGSTQLKAGAVTAKKLHAGAVAGASVRDGTLLRADVKSGQLPNSGPGPQGPRGPAGAVGPAGPRGATGAKGPAGPVGPPGPTGATGPKGISGNVGSAGVHSSSVDISARFTVGANLGATGTSVCPAGTRVLGGGAVRFSAGLQEFGSHPSADGTTWVVEMSGGAGGGEFAVRAICAPVN